MKKIYLSLSIGLALTQVLNPSVNVFKNRNASNDGHLLNKASRSVSEISNKYKRNPLLINFHNINTDLRNSEGLKKFLNNFSPYWTFEHIDVFATYIHYQDNNWEWGNPSFKFSNYVTNELRKILYYVFFLSVVSDILRYFGDNINEKDSEYAINQNIEVVKNIQTNIALINTLNVIMNNTKIKKDGYFLSEINSWNSRTLRYHVFNQYYHSNKLLNYFYRINYDNLSAQQIFTPWRHTNDNYSLLSQMYNASSYSNWKTHQFKTYESFKFSVYNSETNFKILFEDNFSYKKVPPVKKYLLNIPGNFDLKFW